MGVPAYLFVPRARREAPAASGGGLRGPGRLRRTETVRQRRESGRLRHPGRSEARSDHRDDLCTGLRRPLALLWLSDSAPTSAPLCDSPSSSRRGVGARGLVRVGAVPSARGPVPARHRQGPAPRRRRGGGALHERQPLLRADTNNGDGYLVPLDETGPTGGYPPSPNFDSNLWLGGTVGGEVRVAAARYTNFQLRPGLTGADHTPPDARRLRRGRPDLGRLPRRRRGLPRGSRAHGGPRGVARPPRRARARRRRHPWQLRFGRWRPARPPRRRDGVLGHD